MKISLVLGYWGNEPDKGLDMTLEAERLGYHSVWTAEAYGTDAFTPLAYLAARTSKIGLGTCLAQIPARTPAMLAMTATTLDMLSNGRMLLGLGVSGPQVVEGWHGVAYGKPLLKTREYLAIVRDMFRHEGPVTFDGEYYHLPYKGDDATGLGRPLKLIHNPVRTEIPIYLGAMSPKNVALTAELAEGWFPNLLSPLHIEDTFGEQLQEGFARTGGKRSRSNFEIIPQVYVTVGDDLDECRGIEKRRLAMIIGGYGARNKNFYADMVSRFGYRAASDQVQDLYLAGKKKEAANAIPNELIDEFTIVGPRAHVEKQMKIWKASGIDNFAVRTSQMEAVRMIADVMKS